MRIIMATTTSCTVCPIVMRQLDKHGIDYEAIDIRLDEAMENLVVNQLGYMQAPVFVLLDGDDISSATVLDHCGSYDKSRLKDWQSKAAALAA